MRKTKHVFSILLVLIIISVFVPKIADAKDERKLAEELARQFKFFDLAEEILLKELNRTDFTNDTEERNYKYECAVSLGNVYKWHASQLDFQGDTEKASEYREKAKVLIREWTEKRFGDDEKGQIQIAGQILQDGENLIDRAQVEEDPTKREEYLKRAEDDIRQALEIFEKIAKEYKEDIDIIIMNYEEDPDNEEYADAYNILKVSWYRWAKALYLLGKMGIDTKKNYRIAIQEINDISFELSSDAIAFYALLLQGDILFEQENYNKAYSIFESIITTLPRSHPDWGEAAQTEADRIRQEAFYKAANSQLMAKKYKEAVILLRKMIDIDYPTQSQDWYVKLARLLRAEAQIKMGEEPAKVIKEESFVSFSKDPQQYFRGKYYDVLASIGRYPDLDLSTRILCARAAYDQNRQMDAVPIYQLALNQLKDDDEFERYAPEIYFRIGDSFQRTWRFAEASIALIEGAQRLVYLNFKYEGKKEVPVHMQDNFGLKQKYMFMDDKSEYQIDLVRKIAVVLAEKAQQNANWIPDATTNGTQAYEFAREIERRKSNIEGIVGGSEKSLQINFQKEVYDKRYIPTWKKYKSNEKEANFFSTIAGFNALTRIVGPAQYLNSLYVSSDLMNIHFELLMEDKIKYQNAFPEKVDWENSETFVNGSRNYQGLGFYKWEKTRIGEDNLLEITDEMREFIMVYLDGILDPETSQDYRLLYYYKALYFYTKFLFETILIDKPAFEATEEGIFEKDLMTIVNKFCKYVKHQYMKKIGMPVEGPEIKVASVFDEMTAGELQVLMDDFSKAIIDVGLIMRDNPWSAKGHITKRLKDEQELLSESSKQYKENVKKLEKYEELDQHVYKQISIFWADYDENFSIYFIDKENEDKNKALQEKYKGRATVVLQLSFYVLLRNDYHMKAEKTAQAYADVFSEEMSNDNKYQETYILMITNLVTTFSVYNTNVNGKYIEAYELLTKVRASLLGSSFVTIEDLVKSINFSTLEDRTEMRGDEEITINDKENLLETLKDPETGNYRLIENTPFQQYIPDLMKKFIEWATKGEKDKISEYCKEFNFDLDTALNTYFTLVKKLDPKTTDFKDEFIKELKEIGETEAHPVVTQIYDNFLTVVFLNRQYIADQVEKVMNIYREKYITVASRAAKYEYLLYKLTNREKESLNTLRIVGNKLYDAKLYEEAIDMLQKLMTILENDPDRYIFVDGKPAPIARKDDLKFEIIIRSILADCYLNLAKKDIAYSPDNENWKQADFNLTRLFDFILYRFEQQKIGKTDRIVWEKYLDQYYYKNMNNYKELLEAKAKYILNNGGTYTMDTDITSYSIKIVNRNGKQVEEIQGEKIEEVDAKEAAYITITRVLWVCHYLSNQAPSFSPNQRQYKYIEKYKAYLLIAQIGTEEKYREKLVSAQEEYTGLLGDNDLETYEFFGDPEFSIELKKLINQIEEMLKK